MKKFVQKQKMKFHNDFGYVTVNYCYNTAQWLVSAKVRKWAVSVGSHLTLTAAFEAHTAFLNDLFEGCDLLRRLESESRGEPHMPRWLEITKRETYGNCWDLF